jgi:hypothetical protein
LLVSLTLCDVNLFFNSTTNERTHSGHTFRGHTCIHRSAERVAKVSYFFLLTSSPWHAVASCEGGSLSSPPDFTLRSNTSSLRKFAARVASWPCARRLSEFRRDQSQSRGRHEPEGSQPPAPQRKEKSHACGTSTLFAERFFRPFNDRSSTAGTKRLVRSCHVQ